MIPNAWLSKITDKEAFLEEVHPGWEERFPDTDLALDFYLHMEPRDFLRVIRETQ